jgi:TnpA family transposase
MLRVTGSLKLGWVTASLLVQKLQAYPQKNALTLILQEYGRLVRTLHILRWYANQEERRRILRQLNKARRCMTSERFWWSRIRATCVIPVARCWLIRPVA